MDKTNSNALLERRQRVNALHWNADVVAVYF